MRQELRAYLGGLARELKGEALAVNGVAELFHMLASLSATLPVADAMCMIQRRIPPDGFTRNGESPDSAGKRAT